VTELLLDDSANCVVFRMENKHKAVDDLSNLELSSSLLEPNNLDDGNYQ